MDFNSGNISDNDDIKIHTEKINKTLEMIDDLFQSFLEIQKDVSKSEIIFHKTLDKANHDIQKIQDFQEFLKNCKIVREISQVF